MESLWKRTLAAVFCAGLMIGCGAKEAEKDANADLTGALQALLEEVVENHDEVPAAALHVEAPGIGLDWGGAAGVADPSTGAAMTTAHPVRIASNTKTYIAASILRLWEEGRIGLDHCREQHGVKEERGYVSLVSNRRVVAI